MKRPKKSAVKEILKHEFRSMGGGTNRNRYLDSAQLSSGTVVVEWENRSAEGLVEGRVLVTHYLSVVGPDRPCGSFITKSWWEDV